MSEKYNDKKIDEALGLLDELARDKKAELLGMISEKYGNLKSALGGAGDDRGDTAHEAYAQAEKKVKELTSTINEKVHKNPWPYLGGTALGFLILGLLLGRPKK